MSRKKKHEHVNHERWLVSYADFITLLFAFFVVLFASGQADKKKQQKFASAMQQAFSQMALFEPHSKQPALNDSGGPNPDTAPKPVELPMQTGSNADAKFIDTNLRQQVEATIAKNTQDPFAAVNKKPHANNKGLKPGDATVRVTPEGVVLSLHEGGFFASGSASLREDGADALTAIAAQLPPDGNIRVEGHTDNLAIHSAQYASNWELSSARASTIARFLLEHSQINPGHIAVAGYAEFHPVASNTTEEGRAQNRRVDIVFLTKPKQP